MPTSISQRLAWWLLVVGVAPATALADKADDAKAHVANATRAHKEGHYDEARVELEAAYKLAPGPELLYALGQVHAKLGNCPEATAYFQRFAAAKNDPQVAQIVDQAIAACKPSAPAAAPDAASPPSSANPAAPAAAPEPPAWYQDKLGDGLVLGGLAVAVVGLVEYRHARADLDSAEDRASTTTLARYHDLVDSAHGERTAAIVLAGAGSVLIGAGIARYLLHDRLLHDRASEVRGVGVAPAPGGGVVSYAGRF